MYKKSAHTLAETMVVFSLIAFIGTISIIMLNQGSIDSSTKIRIKNCYMEITQIIDKVLNNPRYYSSTEDFTDTAGVNLFGGQEFSEGNTKFKEIIMYEMGQEAANFVNCEAMTTEGGTRTESDCFQGDNNAIWHLPDSDFNIKMYRYNNKNYAPITIYPNPKAPNNKERGYFDSEAVILGVARDGSIGLIQTVDCKLKKYKDYMQCQAESLIAESKAMK